MNHSRFEHDEEELGRLLGVLPPAPEGWVEAAASLPQTQRDAERFLALVEEDRDFRAAAIADLDGALRQAGYDPTPPLLAEIRTRLEGD